MKANKGKRTGNIMSFLSRYASALVAVMLLTLSSCGDDNDDGGGSEDWSQMANTNANSTVGNDRAVARLEVPALHKSGNQILLVHRLSNAGNTTTTGATSLYDSDAVNYIVEWDCEKKSQRWTAYQMHRGYNGQYSRVADFAFDPDLPSQYYYSEYSYFKGFDRGHICPSADRTFSKEANTQTFYMSNMQPQYHQFNGYEGSNSGLWLRMENKVQLWAKNLTKTDTLFICKGGTIDDESNIIKRIDGKLIVPKYFFMAILRKDANGWSAMGFWSEQTSQWRMDETLLSHAMSIDELEEKTGIDFFCNLPDKIEEKVESTFYPKSWGLE